MVQTIDHVFTVRKSYGKFELVHELAKTRIRHRCQCHRLPASAFFSIIDFELTNAYILCVGTGFRRQIFHSPVTCTFYLPFKVANRTYFSCDAYSWNASQVMTERNKVKVLCTWANASLECISLHIEANRVFVLLHLLFFLYAFNCICDAQASKCDNCLTHSWSGLSCLHFVCRQNCMLCLLVLSNAHFYQYLLCVIVIIDQYKLIEIAKKWGKSSSRLASNCKWLYLELEYGSTTS